MPEQQHPIFCIAVDGSPRLLFWVEERTTSNDLTIKVRSPQIMRLIEKPGDPITAHKVVESHFSVHNSYQSKTQINSITGTFVLESGKVVKYPHYTRAIKQTRNYAHIFACRCTDLRHKRFALENPKGRLTSLGEYDPSQFQLIFQVLVSSKDTPKLVAAPNCRVGSIDFETFRVTVIWTFLSLSSGNTGQQFNLFTLKPQEMPMLDDDTRNAFESIADGFPYAQAIESFLGLARYFREDFFQKDFADAPANVTNLCRIIGQFFRDGISKSRHRRHLRKCRAAIASNPALADVEALIKEHK